MSSRVGGGWVSVGGPLTPAGPAVSFGGESCSHGLSSPHRPCPLVMVPVLVCGMAPPPTWLPTPDIWASALRPLLPFPTPSPSGLLGTQKSNGDPSKVLEWSPASALAPQAFLYVAAGGSWYVLKSDHVSTLVTSLLYLPVSHSKAKS